MLRILAQDNKILIVIVLSFKTLLNRCQLIIIPNPLFLQPLDNQFIGLLNAHGLIVLDHGLIKPIFHDSYRAHLGMIITIDIYLLLLELILLVLESPYVFSL